MGEFSAPLVLGTTLSMNPVSLTRRQIDSEIIVDLKLYSQLHPDDMENFGFFNDSASDEREILEHCDCSSPLCEVEDYIYDDDSVERQRSGEIEDQCPHLRMLIEDGKGQLSDDQLRLLPAELFVYVLRARKWGS